MNKTEEQSEEEQGQKISWHMCMSVNFAELKQFLKFKDLLNLAKRESE